MRIASRPSGGSSTPILIAGGTALVAAGLIPLLPWSRWNPRVTLVLPILGLVIMCVSELGSKSSRTADGAMGTATVVTLLFVWIGLTQPQWWPVASAPIVAVALCVVFSNEDAPLSITTIVTGVTLLRHHRRARRVGEARRTKRAATSWVW